MTIDEFCLKYVRPSVRSQVVYDVERLGILGSDAEKFADWAIDNPIEAAALLYGAECERSS